MDRELLRRIIVENYGTVYRFCHLKGLQQDCLSLILNGKRDPGYRTQLRIIKALELTESQVISIFYADVVVKEQHNPHNEQA
ncbi:MAG: hypothetical protein J6T17_06420 [Clostridia bacterium]|nr:hypothetical protein [Clostridia bacterium]